MDTLVFNWINGLPHTEWLDRVVVAVSNFQQTESLIVFCAVFFLGVLFRKPRLCLAIAILFLAFVAVDNLVGGLKVVFNKPRPLQTLQNVHVIGGSPRGSSFPSFQAALVALLFVYTYLLTKKHLFIFAGLVVLVGFSRVYQGFHYPGDILIGWVLGFFGAFPFSWLYRVVHQKLQVLLPGIFKV